MDGELTPPIRAAGGVLWRPAAGADEEPALEIAIVHRPRYDDWSLPKGKVAPGESDLDAALREVLEETGFRVMLGRPLGETRYLKEVGGRLRDKVVRWWAMEARSGSFAPNAEVDLLEWVSLAEAARRLTRGTDRQLLASFAHGPVPSVTIFLVRHATAGSRATWSRDDRLRPLDEHGRRQSGWLAARLAASSVGRVVSADVNRCVQTVEPLAARLALPIEAEPLLSEIGYPGREGEAMDFITSLARLPHNAVACSQGGVIPNLIDRLVRRDGVAARGDYGAKKGGTWALRFEDGALSQLDYMAPPALDRSPAGLSVGATP